MITSLPFPARLAIVCGVAVSAFFFYSWITSLSPENEERIAIKATESGNEEGGVSAEFDPSSRDGVSLDVDDPCLTGEVSEKIPFVQTPACFARHLSSVSWTDGVSRTFSDLKGCRYTEFLGLEKNMAEPKTDFFSFNQFRYQCATGFIATEDPRGVKVCQITTDTSLGGVYFQTLDYKNGTSKQENHFKGTVDCVWREVALF